MQMPSDMRNFKISKIKISIILFFVFFIYAYYNIFAYRFPSKIFTVEKGDNLVSVSKNLESREIIKSPTLFKIIFILLNGKDKVIAFGDYNLFDKGYNMLGVINRLSRGKADQSGTAVLIPEGFTNIDVAKRLSSVLGINANSFYKHTKEYQGKLFPETYFFEKGTNKENVLKKMLSEFENRVGEIKIQDLVLASIIQGEAKHIEDMRIISGILKERLRIKMPLQVDVAPETYKVLGLPKKPINNPGLSAINAVRNPIKTEYIYYITGNDGNMYYAKTFAEHKKNIAKYLKI